MALRIVLFVMLLMKKKIKIKNNFAAGGSKLNFKPGIERSSGKWRKCKCCRSLILVFSCQLSVVSNQILLNNYNDFARYKNKESN